MGAADDPLKLQSVTHGKTHQREDFGWIAWKAHFDYQKKVDWSAERRAANIDAAHYGGAAIPEWARPAVSRGGRANTAH